MAIKRPYRRTCRQFDDGHYSEGGRWQYMIHPKFAKTPEHYVRGFILLQKDLMELFDFIEPSDTNLSCYSYRIHSLLLRACVEVEANCKAILLENGYSKNGNMTMSDYSKLNFTHRLSSYEVKIPNWTGKSEIRSPFRPWETVGLLPWYQAYNATKHNRQEEFQQATFEHLLDAVCGLLVVLSAQFHTNDFSPGNYLIAASGYGPNDGMEPGIGEYFRVKFPGDWPNDLQYSFEWQELEKLEDPFQKFDYFNIQTK